MVDSFAFVRQELVGDGSITVRLTSLEGEVMGTRPGEPPSPGTEPWAKAGLIIKDGTEPGSTYAAIMITGNHGVRMQHDYVHDTAGSSGSVSPAAPVWLRLTRTGSTVTGEESRDGRTWVEVGAATLSGLPSTAQAGLFVSSPEHDVYTQNLGWSSLTGGPSQATAVFDDVITDGTWSSGGWIIDADTDGQSVGPLNGFEESDGVLTVRGSGDIAPDVAGAEGNTVESALVGTFVLLIMVVVVGSMSITTEYRRNLIRTTLAASPGRGRVLAAKAAVVGGATFLIGLVGSSAAFWIVGALRERNGDFSLPVSQLTELRVVAGTAGLLAVGAVFALAVGTVLRRSAATVTVVIGLLVLPYVLSIASVLPSGPATWLLRVTPAAAFAIQQSTSEFAQVGAIYLPSTGFFPLAPWAGFGVLCAWTAVALALAAVLLRRRDA